MFRDSVGGWGGEVESVRRKIEESQLCALRELLPDSAIHGSCARCGYEYRRRLLTPVVVVFHMIAAALWPEKSFQAAWQSLGHGGSSSGRLAEARDRLPLAVMDLLFDATAESAAELSKGYVAWRGHRVVNLDGTCVSMENNPELHDEFGAPNGRYGRSRYPLARCVVLSLQRTMTALSYALGRYVDSENTLAARALDALHDGDLIVADRRFAGANLYAGYAARGLEFVTPKHQRLKVGRLKRLVKHGRGDFVTELPVLRMH